MYNSNNHSNNSSRLKQYIIIAAVSLVLTFPSMEIIKHAPGNAFSTDIELVATYLLVFGLWFLAITACTRLVWYQIDSRKSKENPSDKNMKALVAKETKGFKRLEKVAIWTITLAAIGFLLMLIAMAIIFAGAAHH